VTVSRFGRHFRTLAQISRSARKFDRSPEPAIDSAVHRPMIDPVTDYSGLPPSRRDRWSGPLFRWAMVFAAVALVVIAALIIYAIYVTFQLAG
jgi:hypothetical protein